MKVTKVMGRNGYPWSCWKGKTYHAADLAGMGALIESFVLD